jgi:hypothetical protein
MTVIMADTQLHLGQIGPTSTSSIRSGAELWVLSSTGILTLEKTRGPKKIHSRRFRGGDVHASVSSEEN